MPVPQAAASGDDPRRLALAKRAAGDHAGALLAFEAAGPDPWSRNDAAIERLALGRIGEAEDAARALLRDVEGFAPAWRTLGLAARRRGDHEAALDAFRRAATLAPHDLWNRQDEASELRALGRLAEAEAAYRALAGGTPLPHAVRGLGLVARERGDHESALGHFRIAAELCPGDPWFGLDVARALAALGREEAADETLAGLAGAHPGFIEGHRERARLARRRGDRAGELAHWRTAAALDSGEPGAALDLADALLAQGASEEAETIAARCLVLAPGLVRAYALLAAAARRGGNGALALAHSAAAARVGPDVADRQADLAADLLSVGRAAEAEAAALAVLALDREQEGAHRVRRLQRQASGDAAGAMALARERWRGGEGPSRAGFDLAADHRAAGEWDAADAVLAMLAARPDAAVEARLERGILARRRDGVEAAEALFAEALALDPAHPRTHLLLGDLARERGARDVAADHYGAALRARPGFTWALIGQALLARDAGDTAGAEANWRAAIAADPAEGHAQIELAGERMQRGAFDEARAILAGIPGHSPRAPQAAMAEARLQRAKGDFAGAADAFAAVARRWPAAMVEALIEGAEDEARAGRAGACEAALDRARQAAPGHPALLEALACHALARDDLGAAAELLARAETADPARLSVVLLRARVSAMAGHASDARARFAAAEARFGPRPEIAMASADIERQLGEPGAASRKLAAARALWPGHALLGAQAALGAIESGDFETAHDWLAHPTAEALPGRARFVRAQIAAARWDFGTAIAEGDAAVALLPGEGWVRNRLIHAALLAFDLPRAGRELVTLARLEAAANRRLGKSANPSQSHYGQLYDEFRLDTEAADALRSALAATPEDRLERLSATVRAFPASTAAAILHGIEARRRGVFDHARPAPGPSPIPRVIHQYWNDEEVPADVAAYMASWREAHPGFRHRVWSDADALAFLAGSGPAEATQAYRRAREPAMKADLFRLALLAREGGVWVDADDRCLKSIEPLVSDGVGLLGYQEDLGSIGNNILAVAPGHPVIARALHEACDAVNRGDGDILWLSTGPGLLTRILNGALCGGSLAVEHVRILDRSPMLAHAAIHCLAAYKASERHWSRTAFGRARPKAPGGDAQATRATSPSS